MQLILLHQINYYKIGEFQNQVQLCQFFIGEALCTQFGFYEGGTEILSDYKKIIKLDKYMKMRLCYITAFPRFYSKLVFKFRSPTVFMCVNKE